MLSKGVWGNDNKMTCKQTCTKNKKNRVYAAKTCELNIVLYAPITNIVRE